MSQLSTRSRFNRRNRRVSDERSVQASGGIGFFGLLAIVFITLKLCHVIDWSWWLVLLPIYGPLLLALMVLGVVLLILYVVDK